MVPRLRCGSDNNVIQCCDNRTFHEVEPRCIRMTYRETRKSFCLYMPTMITMWLIQTHASGLSCESGVMSSGRTIIIIMIMVMTAAKSPHVSCDISSLKYL